MHYCGDCVTCFVTWLLTEILSDVTIRHNTPAYDVTASNQPVYSCPRTCQAMACVETGLIPGQRGIFESHSCRQQTSKLHEVEWTRQSPLKSIGWTTIQPKRHRWEIWNTRMQLWNCIRVVLAIFSKGFSELLKMQFTDQQQQANLHACCFITTEGRCYGESFDFDRQTLFLDLVNSKFMFFQLTCFVWINLGAHKSQEILIQIT